LEHIWYLVIYFYVLAYLTHLVVTKVDNVNLFNFIAV